MRRPAAALLSLLMLLVTLSGAASASTASFLAPLPERSLLINLINPDGEPIHNAEIHLLTPGENRVRVIRTDLRGQATLRMPDGFSFWVRVWAGGYGLIEQAYVPAADGPVLTLKATPLTAALTGFVTDETGLPVEGAKVTLFRAGYGLEATTRSDEAGFYLLPALRAQGGYTLQVEAPGFRPESQTDLNLAGGTRTQLDLALTPATATITGAIIHPRTSRPIGGATIELLLSGWGVILRTQSDGTGSFLVPAPPADGGTYQLRISRPGSETITTAAIPVTPGGWTDFSGTNRLTLNPLYAEFTGFLLDDGGNPVPDTLVELQRLDLGGVEQHRTDAKGGYRFTEIPAGTYRVRALTTGDQIQTATPWTAVSGGQRVTADIAAVMPRRDSYGSSGIVGTVSDHLGDPVAGATVQIRRGSENWNVTTDETGRYQVSVQANLPTDPDDEAGTGYHIMVTAPGFLPSDQWAAGDGAATAALFDVRQRAANRADITLQPETGAIAGLVMTGQGRPAAGAVVALVQEGKGEVARTKADGSGRYAFPALPVAKQARYLPVVRDSRYIEGTIAPDGALIDPVNLQPGGAVTQVLAVRPAITTVQGLVRTGEQKLATGGTVSLLRPADGRAFSAPVSTAGTYRIQVPAVPGDRFLVRVEGGPAANASPDALIPGDAWGANVNLVSHPTAALTGLVYGPDGQPAAGIAVQLYTEGSNTRIALANTDNYGRYRFSDLTPGQRYTVVASHGLGLFSAGAPGELVITPLVALPGGETEWADLQLPESSGR